MTRADKLLPGGIPRWVRCYDNEGESADRYSVVFTGRYTQRTEGQHVLLSMNSQPSHPQGIGQHGYYQHPPDTYTDDRAQVRWPPAIGRKHWRKAYGKRIAFTDLPLACQAAVLDTYRVLWAL